MTAPPNPPIKSLTTTTSPPPAAELRSAPPAVGGWKNVAEGVRTGRNREPDPTPEAPGIRIYAPPVYRYHDDPARWSLRTADTPYAAFACACGETANATGLRNATALITRYEEHKEACSHHADQNNDRPLVARYTRRNAA
ncbi:hypothetical protein ACFWSJ_26950 [Streptomyces niveus]|uniref:hypothetical protein n=1 Tax=Streptomyces niveus TaxID=193462 RepID=UPI0036485998